ncbi:receptor kinase-like protein Xa21 [Triticum aestivum]|nr:receptor kinase-like protein Xa21 [Triticum aestivum]XP_044403542.1 receptor kinase-like protein Xa21 [Triticum aestivum]XP_044403543.1 receptor kinase-like protein Xa21 [Triticum aestivum]
MRSPKQPAKLVMLLLLALLLLCNGVGNVHCTRIHENSVDLHALLDFKQGINNPQEALSNWSTTTHFCRWNGVICTTTRPFRVLSLILTELDLAGQISSSLGNLTFLETLDLSYNNFVGPLPVLGHLQQLQTLSLNNNRLNGMIPDSLTNCSSLDTLDLSVNFLVGPIPPNLDLLSNLTYLDLSSNMLVGQIPPKLVSLSKLVTLDLSHNMLVGPIPPNLDLLSNLTYLDLSRNLLVGQIPLKIVSLPKLATLDLSTNMLVGQIPPKLGFVSSLEYFSLASNKLEGSIPNELGQLPSLQYLLLGENNLSGEFPHSILNRNLSVSLLYLGLELNMLGKVLPPNIGDLRGLVHLTMSGNMFEGHIPASLGNATGLKVIDLSANNFTGQIPNSFGKLSNLTNLNLQYNQLETRDWEFFNALTNCRSLNSLSLGFNQLQGSIPQSVGNLSNKLEKLTLTQNSLSGQVPQSIGNLSALNQLALGINNLSGTIEGWIGNLKGLEGLTLRSNRFTGQIPPSISNLTRLINLYLYDNQFEGLIPPSLGNLPLTQLVLSSNNLYGYIPPSLGSLQQLTSLNLSHNNLQGEIPQISALKQLTTLDLSSNKLTGSIPDSLGQCYGLRSLQMDQNFLSGNIPIAFGKLLSLSILNLSHNNLSGTIPSALNKLEFLNHLDLSYNHLEGKIPRDGAFENATAVSLENNWGLCGGAVDLHMASCTTISKKEEERRYRLIKVLIPIFGFLSLVLLIYFVLLEKKMRRANDTSASLGENFLKVSYADLAQATSNFSESNLVGRGGYGSVYRGKLKDSKVEVAVKVFDLEMHGAERSFLKECEALRSIQHRNLLPIITACSTVDNTGNVFKALVYEFMPNGNLDTWLHHREDGKAHKHLSLAQRLDIAVNMADALDYLHHDCGRPTIHCDLKPSNILLDDDMTALLGDFGIASFYQDSRSTSPGSVSSSSVGMKGTIGYIGPEYAGGGRHASTCGDVYGFGIILLEMMTGKRPTDPLFKDGVSIVDFVESNFPHEIVRVIDANLSEECKDIAQSKKISENSVHQCLLSVLQLALSCTHPVPGERMNMKVVASKMHAIKTSYGGCNAQE